MLFSDETSISVTHNSVVQRDIKKKYMKKSANLVLLNQFYTFLGQQLS